MSKIISKEIKDFINQYLNNNFFERNIPSERSAYNILDFAISVDSIDDEIYGRLPEDRKREIDCENKKAQDENDIDRLYNMLRKELNANTVNIVLDKLIKNKEKVMPRMLEDLKRSGNDSFVEKAAKLFVKCDKNYSHEIAQILPDIRYPYTQSVMCFILGKIGSEEDIKIIYKYFLYFKDNYRTENYYEGPLLGIYEMKDRYKF